MATIWTAASQLKAFDLNDPGFQALYRRLTSQPAVRPQRGQRIELRPQEVPWTDEQWARANQVIQEEASRTRVAATFLPLVGPLPSDAQQVAINDTATMRLATLQVKGFIPGAQMADPEMTSVLAPLRRAANTLARLEDAVVFRGLAGSAHFAPPPRAVADLPPTWEISNGEVSEGIVGPPAPAGAWAVPVALPPRSFPGPELVQAIVRAINLLDACGQYGPFVAVLGNEFFTGVLTPTPGMVGLPKDIIIPLLGSGGSLLRSPILLPDSGTVVSLGGAPIELVIATDASLDVLPVRDEPRFVFRVFEKMGLRINEPQAIAILGADEH